MTHGRITNQLFAPSLRSSPTSAVERVTLNKKIVGCGRTNTREFQPLAGVLLLHESESSIGLIRVLDPERNSTRGRNWMRYAPGHVHGQRPH